MLRLQTLGLVAGIMCVCLGNSAVAAPAPVKDHSKTYFGKNASAAGSVRALGSGRYITVRKGDTLYGISKKYGIPAKELISLNGLKDPYSLRVGQRVKVNAARSYKVKKGDSLSKIASAVGTNVDDLVYMNRLKKPYALKIGQELRLPYHTVPASLNKGKKQFAMSKKPSKYNSKSRTYMSKRYASAAAKVAKPVQAKPIYRVSYTKPVKTAKTASKRLATLTKKKSTKPIAKGKQVGTKHGRTKFSWPAKGRLVGSYGPKKGGVFNDGINISAPIGREIKAAASGKVVYVGNELKGYGNLMIVKHKGGWMTAYAHQQRFAVKQGQKVKKGQVIGYVGNSGNVDHPQLHFAIRKGKEAVNPVKYLPS